MEIKSEQLWALVLPRLRTYLGQTWNVELVASVTGSTKATVTGWLADQTPPAGRLIQLWHMLEATGLESPELKELPDFNRYCGELLTFSVIDMDELKDICNVANAQGVLAMLRGTPPMRPQYSLKELKTLYDAQLQSRRSDMPQVASMAPSNAPESVINVQQESSKSSSSVRVPTSSNVLFTASKLVSVLPLVRHFESDNCSPEQRSDLRRLVGGDEMFELSNRFNNLCSERARDHGRSGQR